MPLVGIVMGAVGASVGTAAFAGTMLAGYGGMIGAGIAGGLYSSSMGGDFGKGFLMGAAGNFIGGQIGKAFGGIGGGVTQDAMLADQMAGFTNVGDITGELGWGGDIGSVGSAGFGSSLSTSAINGDMTTADFGSAFGEQNMTPVGGEEFGVGIDGQLVQDPSTVSGTMEPWSPGGAQGNGVETFGLSDSGVSNPYSVPETTATDYSSINPQSSYPGSNGPDLSSGLDNITSSAPASGGNPAGDFGTPTQSGGYMDRLKGWVSDSDASLAKYGMPKGSTVLGLAGMGQYMMGNYETYKAEQIAKGMKPLTLEEFQNKMYNSNDYKTAANSMAQSGRTGTLPALLARMKQQSSMDYTKNYQPTANNNWWNVNANISNQRMNNLGNLTQPLSMAWAMNQGKR